MCIDADASFCSFTREAQVHLSLFSLPCTFLNAPQACFFDTIFVGSPVTIRSPFLRTVEQLVHILLSCGAVLGLSRSAASSLEPPAVSGYFHKGHGGVHALSYVCDAGEAGVAFSFNDLFYNQIRTVPPV